MKQTKLIYLVMLTVILIANALLVCSTPDGPEVTYIKNETKDPTSALMINTTGGSVTTMNLNASSQNYRWKAFVGNVTGKLTLDDASESSVFDWDLSVVTGEVYATRASSTISWANINCSNTTHITNEEISMNHTSNPNDNISKTFSTKSHSEFFVGTIRIPQNSCYSIHTFVNDSSQSSDFEEMILYDGTDTTNGDIVYATVLESAAYGFDGSKYDFQMILPENGMSNWDSATPYYFYVELT